MTTLDWIVVGVVWSIPAWLLVARMYVDRRLNRSRDSRRGPQGAGTHEE